MQSVRSERAKLLTLSLGSLIARFITVTESFFPCYNSEMADIEAQIHSVTGNQPASTTTSPQLPQPAVIAAAQPTSTTANPQTTNPTRPNTADAQPQATSTNDRDAPPSQIAGNPDPQQGMLI